MIATAGIRIRRMPDSYVKSATIKRPSVALSRSTMPTGAASTTGASVGAAHRTKFHSSPRSHATKTTIPSACVWAKSPASVKPQWRGL